jgi:hypothetical protein
MAIKQDCCKIFQMTSLFTNIFNSKALQICPNLDFWFEKYHLATLDWTWKGNCAWATDLKKNR